MGHNVHRHLRDQENYNRVRTVQGPKIAGRHHSTMAKHIYIKKKVNLFVCFFGSQTRLPDSTRWRSKIWLQIKL